MEKLDGKGAVIPGTSSDIGGGIAEEIAAEGAAVVCVDVRAENASDCARGITSSGGRAMPITCDVTKEAQVKSAIDRPNEAFGGGGLPLERRANLNNKGAP